MPSSRDPASLVAEIAFRDLSRSEDGSVVPPGRAITLAMIVTEAGDTRALARRCRQLGERAAALSSLISGWRAIRADLEAFGDKASAVESVIVKWNEDLASTIQSFITEVKSDARGPEPTRSPLLIFLEYMQLKETMNADAAIDNLLDKYATGEATLRKLLKTGSRRWKAFNQLLQLHGEPIPNGRLPRWLYEAMRRRSQGV